MAFRSYPRLFLFLDAEFFLSVRAPSRIQRAFESPGRI
jgi:hypothetical protein|tara:strand:+ start:2432 stop:2545 length:114 start_codon:yes stop_codon:yes gene_type:complete